MNAPIDSGVIPYVLSDTRDGVRTLVIRHGHHVRETRLLGDRVTQFGQLDRNAHADILTRDSSQHGCTTFGAAAGYWTSADVRPYLAHALDVFGPRRCLVGSDWPLVTLAGTMERWVDAVLDVLGPLSDSEQRAVLYDTAVAVYGVEP